MGDETVVRSSCWSCGTIDLAVDAVTVYVVPGSADPTYGFHCPRCLAAVRKSTTAEAVALLVAAGVGVVEVPPEAAEDKRGAPLTTDDLIDLGRALTASDDLARFAALPRPPLPQR
ncbi:MAG: hypothetical protein ACYDB7_13950 [Mycobacteriales bacterium]